MKNRMIALMFAALLSLAAVACAGGTATDDGGAGVGDPGTTDPLIDDGTGGDPMIDDGTGTAPLDEPTP
jgi:hypothetical protein